MEQKKKSAFKKAKDYLKDTSGVDIFRDAAAQLYKTPRAVRKAVQKTKPVAAVKSRRVKINKNSDKQYETEKARTRVKRVAKSIDSAMIGAGGALKFTGVALFGGAQALMWAGSKIALDNALIRKMASGLSKTKTTKRDVTDKKANALRSAVIKYPNASAYLMYWTTLALMTLGTYKYIGDNNDNNEVNNWLNKVSEWVKDSGEKTIITLDPKSDDFFEQCKLLENKNLIGIVYTERHRKVAKVQTRENVSTDGFGMTWSVDKNGNMTIRNYADTPDNRKKGRKPHKPTPGKTLDTNVKETKSFIKGHVDNKIKAHMTREFSENEYQALCIAGYQLEGHLPTMCKQLSAAKTTQEIADAFITTTMYNYGGTPKRRWVCAMLATGLISRDDMLNADIDAFYSPDLNTFMRDGKFICNSSTIEYVMGLKGTGGTTRAMIEQLSDGRKALAEMAGTTRPKTKSLFFAQDENKKIEASMKQLINANKEYAAKRYEKAAKLFEDAIKEDPDNMEAYSSLALVYKKLGDDNKSIEFYKKSLDVVVACNSRMNANKALLYDSSVKASSYYNAGLSRQAMGDIYKSGDQFVMAKTNYDLAKTNYETAILNIEKTEGQEAKRMVYQNALIKINMLIKTLEQDKAKKFKSANDKVSANAPLNKINKVKININKDRV